MVLEPIFEASQTVLVSVPPEPESAKRDSEIHLFTSESINYRWIFEADIKACFDEIDQRL